MQVTPSEGIEAAPGPTRLESGSVEAVSARTQSGAGLFDPGAEPSVEALAAATSLFAEAFHRWSNRRAVLAGANLTRLRLLHLVRCRGALKMADLADELGVTPRSVTALVDGLEAEGLVRRLPHGTDRRVTLVELTCRRELVQAQMAAYQASIENLFAEMTEPDRATLVRLLVGLLERMNAGAAEPARQESLDA